MQEFILLYLVRLLDGMIGAGFSLGQILYGLCRSLVSKVDELALIHDGTKKRRTSNSMPPRVRCGSV